MAESTDAQFEHAESFDVVNRPEVQQITLESTAEDMGGYIVVWFMGESSPSIYIDSNADAIKQGLEGISTIESVDVSISPHSQDSLSKSWIITFTAQTGNLPSLLVDTGPGLPSTIAAGGTLLGSSSVVRVETVVDGGLPRSFITPSTLSSDKTYISRVLAFNGYSWSDPASSRHAISPSKGAPSSPREVRVNVLSDTELGVSWTQPIYSGGDPLSSYRLEWDTDAMFDHAATTVSHTPGNPDYYFVLSNLDPLESYFVRVMSYSAMGFSEPIMAVPLLSNTQTIDISLVETTGTVDYAETFIIEYSTSDGFQRYTNPISAFATSREVENELNSLGQVGAISVDREDRSSTFDSSGVDTDFFSILYMVTFVGVDDDVLLLLMIVL